MIPSIVRNKGKEFVKVADVASTLMARDYKGLGNQDGNAVITCEHIADLNYYKHEESDRVYSGGELLQQSQQKDVMMQEESKSSKVSIPDEDGIQVIDSYNKKLTDPSLSGYVVTRQGSNQGSMIIEETDRGGTRC